MMKLSGWTEPYPSEEWQPRDKRYHPWMIRFTEAHSYARMWVSWKTVDAEWAGPIIENERKNLFWAIAWRIVVFPDECMDWLQAHLPCAHEVVDDHCGMKHHRHCFHCGKDMPNAPIG